MKGKKVFLISIFLLILLAGCDRGIFFKKPQQADQDQDSIIKTVEGHPETTLREEDFQTQSYSLDRDQVEELDLADLNIAKKHNLNIVKIKDGTLYGVGSGFSGDGTREDNLYKMSFDGKKKAISRGGLISLIYELRGEDYYYYSGLENNNMALYRVGLDKLDREKIYEFENINTEILWADDNYIYFNKHDDIDRNSYYRLNILSQDISRLNIEEQLGNKPLRKRENSPYIYASDYKEGRLSNLYIYDIKNLKSVLIERDAGLKHMASNKKYILFYEYEEGRLLLFNQDKARVDYELVLDDFYKLYDLYKDRYILYENKSHEIEVLDLKEKVRMVVDIGGVDENLEDKSMVLKLEGGYLYVQLIERDWDKKDPSQWEDDRIFRIDYRR